MGRIAVCSSDLCGRTLLRGRLLRGIPDGLHGRADDTARHRHGEGWEWRVAHPDGPRWVVASGQALERSGDEKRLSRSAHLAQVLARGALNQHGNENPDRTVKTGMFSYHESLDHLRGDSRELLAQELVHTPYGDGLVGLGHGGSLAPPRRSPAPQPMFTSSHRPVNPLGRNLPETYTDD